MDARIYIFAAGGSGGHLYPGLAVAERLRRVDPAARMVFACSGRAIDRRILDPLACAIVPQPVLPLPRGAGGWGKFIRAWREASLLARRIVRDLTPAAVLGVGGFAAAPVVRAAAAAGIRCGLLNCDAVPGRANRHLASRAEAIFTQFESTRGHFSPRLRHKVRCVGCPVRSALSAGDRGEAIRHFDLAPRRRTLLVFGASGGAASINRAASALAPELAELAEKWQVLHISGPGKGAAWAPAGKLLVRQLEYCDRMELAYAAADLVLCRAGASTVAELAAAATPAVLMPYPHHRDRQQYLNAAASVASGAATIVEDVSPAANVEALRATLIGLLRDGDRLDEMYRAAKRLACPSAAEKVAAWMAAGAV